MILPTIVAIGLTLGSVHSKPGFNGINPGAYAVTQDGYAAGAYLNSHSRASVWAGRMFEAKIAPAVSAGLLVGGVTGYGRPTVLAAASLRVEVTLGASLRLTYVPKHPAKPDASDALLLAVESKF